MPDTSSANFKSMNDFTLADLESLRLLIRGGSVVDWYRLNFQTKEEVNMFLAAHEICMEDKEDIARCRRVQEEAVRYLRSKFEFPIPKPVAQSSLPELLLLASGQGHRQLCACSILKVMHIIHHLEARELLFMLPASDEEVFAFVEHKLYRIIGTMLAMGFPITEFIGGRKNRDSLYTKLLSKPEANAAQIYDKLRFRLVTRSVDDLLPVLHYLTTHIFPFTYVVPGESKNSLIPFFAYCKTKPHLKNLLPELQLSPNLENDDADNENQFSSLQYKILQFVMDMPIHLPQEMLDKAPDEAKKLGKNIFIQVEFQLLDQQTDSHNELGDSSHVSYKARQNESVQRRLKLGLPGEDPETMHPNKRDL